MKLLDRYLLREYMLPVFYCLSTFCMMFILGDLFGHMAKFLKAKTPLLLILRYYLFLLVPMLEYLLPASLLMATLYTLWQLTRSNQITAMRSGGMSLYRVMFPFLVVGLAFSLLTVALKECVSPRLMSWTMEFKSRAFAVKDGAPSTEQIYFYNSAEHRMWFAEGFDPATPDLLTGVEVTQERPDRSRLSVTRAERAEYLDGQWYFFDVRVQLYGLNDIPIGAESEPATDSSLGVVMLDLNEEPDHFVGAATKWELLNSYQMARYLRLHPNLSAEEAARKRVDYHNRLATPWACIIVIVFGIPVGAGSGRHGGLTGIFMAIGMLLAFYAVTQAALILGKMRIIWPWLAAWLSNILFLVSGLIMVRKLR